MPTSLVLSIGRATPRSNHDPVASSRQSPPKFRIAQPRSGNTQWIAGETEGPVARKCKPSKIWADPSSLGSAVSSIYNVLYMPKGCSTKSFPVIAVSSRMGPKHDSQDPDHDFAHGHGLSNVSKRWRRMLCDSFVHCCVSYHFRSILYMTANS